MCLTLFEIPWTGTHQAPLPMGFPRQEYWSGLPFSSLGDLPDSGIKPVSPAPSASPGRFFTPEPSGKSKIKDRRRNFIQVKTKIKCISVQFSSVQFSHSVVSNSYNPMNCGPPGSSVHGISQAKILEWVAIFFSRGSSRPRDQTHISCIGKWVPFH